MKKIAVNKRWTQMNEIDLEDKINDTKKYLL